MVSCQMVGQMVGPFKFMVLSIVRPITYGVPKKDHTLNFPPDMPTAVAAYSGMNPNEPWHDLVQVKGRFTSTRDVLPFGGCVLYFCISNLCSALSKKGRTSKV